jgi:hypothetical protein
LGYIAKFCLKKQTTARKKSSRMVEILFKKTITEIINAFDRFISRLYTANR